MQPSSSSTSEGGGQSNHWSKQNPPNKGGSETNTITLDGAQTQVKYCCRCKRCTKGEKAHLTSEHKTRAELDSSGSSHSATQRQPLQGNAGQIGGFLGTGVLFVGNLGYSGEIRDPDGPTPYGPPHDFLVELYSDHYLTIRDSIRSLTPRHLGSVETAVSQVVFRTY
jgi:hypothetical protein